MNFNHTSHESLKKFIIISFLLKFISFFYSFIIFLRNLFYDKGLFPVRKLPGKCISIGNITVGGSGKSPFIMYLLDYLTKKGLEVVVLTRGYKSGLRREHSVLIKGGKIYNLFGASYDVSPDEALMYSNNYPKASIIVGSKRYKAATLYLKNYKKPDLWLLDDGFQHRAIHRDLDFVLFDVASHLQDQMLPFGLLREQFSSLKRAHYAVLTYCTSFNGAYPVFDKIRPYMNERFVLESVFRNDWPINVKNNQKMTQEDMPSLLVCGIAQPNKFIKAIKNFKIELSGSLFLGDHEPISFVERKVLKDSKSLIITEKDYHRSSVFFDSLGLPIFFSKLVLKVKLDHSVL